MGEPRGGGSQWQHAVHAVQQVADDAAGRPSAMEELPAFQKVAVLHRVGRMLRRKVGHEREDKAYDALMRSKDLHICMFSMTGLGAMIVGGATTWYTGEFRDDTKWEEADATIKTVMLCLQLVVSLTTVVAICLIAQYYRLLLLNKRKEWSGVDLENPTAEEEERMSVAYSFWQSDYLKYQFMLEVAVHVIHPIFAMQSFSHTFYTLCQIWMFTRIYLFIRILHTFSKPYKLRIEIINSNREFQSMNLRIRMGLTLKMLFYSRTGTVLFVSTVATLMVFSFCIFLLERDAQRNDFGRLENVAWFSFITFTTIGFGDFAPVTTAGRFVTVLLGIAGVIITTMFAGVLTNRMAPTKVQRFVVEYLKIRDCLDVYRDSAATLIQSTWRQYHQRRKASRAGPGGPAAHKGNRIYGAVKAFRRARFGVKGAVLPSMDPVLEDKIQQLKGFLRELNTRLQEQQLEMKSLQEKVNNELAQILHALRR
eukprot:TRINITY_DN25208_c0_g1_i1.p1 TRINITY_DN25208_c0_g1~~TRINITY_DN25208_c0_g1_i1.p1  ORF type:complete len:515 (+),score=217.94 TRINITY_DN25208_c0_g1_i1:106-1545(+)